jgi:hypothetical protein
VIDRLRNMMAKGLDFITAWKFDVSYIGDESDQVSDMKWSSG